MILVVRKIDDVTATHMAKIWLRGGPLFPENHSFGIAQRIRAIGNRLDSFVIKKIKLAFGSIRNDEPITKVTRVKIKESGIFGGPIAGL